MTLTEFLEANLAELPEAAKKRLQETYGLDDYTATVIAGDPPAIRLYDQAVLTAQEQLNLSQHDKSLAKTVAKFLCNDLFALIRDDQEQRRAREGEEVSSTATTSGDEEVYSKVNGPQLGELVAMLQEEFISTTQAKKILTILYQEESTFGLSPRELAQQRGLQLITDANQLEQLCRETIEQFPEQLEQYKKGGKHVIKMKKFLVGKAMALSRGNAHPERIHEALEEVLEEVAPGVE